MTGKRCFEIIIIIIITATCIIQYSTVQYGGTVAETINVQGDSLRNDFNISSRKGKTLKCIFQTDLSFNYLNVCTIFMTTLCVFNLVIIRPLSVPYLVQGRCVPLSLHTLWNSNQIGSSKAGIKWKTYVRWPQSHSLTTFTNYIH